MQNNTLFRYSEYFHESVHCVIVFSMESTLYVCRLCLKAFRTHGWALRHEEACVGAIQVVMLDGPQIRPEYQKDVALSVGLPEVR